MLSYKVVNVFDVFIKKLRFAASVPHVFTV